MVERKFTSKESLRTFLKKFVDNKSFELKTENCNYTLDIISVSIDHSSKTLSFSARLRECKSHNGFSDIVSNYYKISFDYKKGLGTMNDDSSHPKQ